MPKVNPERDDVMAETGFVRASIVAKVFRISASTIVKWPSDKVAKLNQNGLSWLDWSLARKFREAEANAFHLPENAKELLAHARSTSLV